MKTINYLPLCILALVVLGCTKSNLAKTGYQSVKDITLSCVAEQQVDENATKTAIGTGNTIVWSANDILSVLSYTTEENNDQFTLSSGSGNVSGRFTGTLTEGASKYYALYPYAADASYNGTTVSFNLPQNQAYAAGSFGRGANPSIAAFTDPSENLSFKNICGVFKLSLTGSVTVTKIAISDDSGNIIWGNVSLTADSNIGTDAQTLTLTGGNNTIYLTDINETLTGIAKSFYFVAPKGAFAAGFTAYVYTNAGIYTYISTTKANTVSRSKIMAMPEAAVSAPSSKDLGGNSNCFIVPCAGTYTFTTNKGKGGDVVTPETVEVLWETVNTTSAPTVGGVINSVSSSGTTISFTATGVAGNGVIAAKVDDEIVWSWHIWSTAAPIELRKYPTTKTVLIRGSYYQDRNLGAVSKTPGQLCSGLQYQWGRKDPFYGSASLTEDGISMATTVTGTANDFIITLKTDENSTIAASIQNPMTLICTEESATNPWINGNDYTGLWSNLSKTQYDPCPKGYRVPSINYNDGVNINPYYIESLKGMLFEGDYYPVVGFLSAKYNGSQGTISGITNKRMHLFTSKLCDLTHPYYYCILSTSIKGYHDVSNACRNIRCIKE